MTLNVGTISTLPNRYCTISYVQYQMYFFNNPDSWTIEKFFYSFVKKQAVYPSALFDHPFTPRKRYTKYLWIIQKNYHTLSTSHLQMLRKSFNVSKLWVDPQQSHLGKWEKFKLWLSFYFLERYPERYQFYPIKV